MVEPSWGATRTEEDALAHIQRLIASDPHTTKWHLVLDNLNIHQSEALVRWVAEREEIDQETLGVKGKKGILRSMESRAAFLQDPPPSGGILLYAQTRLLNESGRNLAEYFGAQAAQTRQFHRAFRFARPNPGVHRVLQSHDG